MIILIVICVFFYIANILAEYKQQYENTISNLQTQNSILNFNFKKEYYKKKHLKKQTNLLLKQNEQLENDLQQATEKIKRLQLSLQVANRGVDIVQYANLFVGNPYVWGGNSLFYGCDCSHFVWNILKDLGYYNGQYVIAENFIYLGESIDGIENAAAGDVIIYPGHVAIYDGNGRIIQAQSSFVGITNTRYYNCDTILGIRRFYKN